MTGILITSFGTAHNETRQKNITAIKNEAEKTGLRIYEAFTSPTIINIIKKRGEKAYTIGEAFECMKKDGIDNVRVLPTLLLYGHEYRKLKEKIELEKEKSNCFDTVKMAKPLLSDEEEITAILKCIYDEMKVENDKMLVFMGHGTTDFSNIVYSAINYILHSKVAENAILGTVEAFPQIEDVIKYMKHTNMKKAVLTPFMFVAGEHAKNDMASDKSDSWKSILEKENIETEIYIKGLGEYAKVKEIYLTHLQEIL